MLYNVTMKMIRKTIKHAKRLYRLYRCLFSGKLDKAGRYTMRYERWRFAVLKRDGFRCRDCGDGGLLHAHHILPWATNPHHRYDIENGIALCPPCHATRHEWMS